MVDGSPKLLQRLKQKTYGLRHEVLVMYLAVGHPATPWYAKVLAAGIVIYAVSPLDLIPDPIPVLGYLDDLILVPLGVLAVRWMIPVAVLAECRAQAARGVSIKAWWKWTGGIVIVPLWLVCLVWMGLSVWHWATG